MSRLFILLGFLLLLACRSPHEGGEQNRFTLHARQINDDYTIEFRKPAGFDAAKSYTLVYVFDGSIGLGDYMLARDSNWSARIPSNCIIVAIGHTGDYHTKRRRDFIPSDGGGDADKNFGQASAFYQFLKQDLIPFVEEKLPARNSRVLIGHSFSGLFCLYAALQGDGLFDQYFAISPSVWANDLQLLKTEASFAAAHTDLPANIHLYVDGLEIFNRVISSTNKFYDAVKKRKYPGLSIDYETIGGANHFSVRKPAIDRILRLLEN